MGNKDIISVVVPVYNAEKFLKQSIGSVIGQSYPYLELILINDGSIDNSEAICKEYATIDKRIKVISQRNSGPAAARNNGISHATGAFVFFLDADDFIDSKTFEILIDKYNEHQPDLVMGNFCKLENNGKIVNQSVTFSPDGSPFTGEIKILSKEEIIDFIRHFLKHPSNHLVSYCWARLYKLSVIKNNNISANEDMRLFEDFVFNLEYLKHIDKIVFVNKPLYTYVMPNNHVTASMAIINSESLLHDMNLFKQKTGDFFQQVNFGFKSAININKEIGHTLIHYTIIFLVRSCRQIGKNNKKLIYDEIRKMVNAPIIKDNLRYYSPQKGNSRILPLLMKLKLIKLIIYFCKHKAYKRYGKLKLIEKTSK
ncbi:MAG: glycosyltransferase [Patescibacteria group bacterium]